jgi:O-antigen/teichoic acid export membrane protein
VRRQQGLLGNLLSMSGVNVVKALVQFAMMTLMTRFVGPAEYGLVTFSLPFMAFIALFTDLGMSSAMIQRPSLSNREAGAAITLMASIGLGCALVMSVLSAPLAGAVGMAGLPAVLSALCASIVLSICALGPRALLERALDYRRIAIIEASATLAAFVTGVALALAGFGIWSLVIFYVLTQAIRAVWFWLAARKWVELNFDWGHVGVILHIGGWVLASNLLNFGARNAGNFLIGAWLGPAAVGLYGLATQFMMLPLMMLSWPASGVLLATLSNNAAREARRSPAPIVAAMLRLTALAAFPSMFYLVFGAHYLAKALISPRWGEAAPLIAVLAPVGAIQSLATYVGAVLLSRGEARLQFWTSAANSLLMIGTFLWAPKLGLLGIAKLYFVASTFLCCGLVYLVARKSELSMAELGKSLAPGFLATSVGLVLVGFLVGEAPSTFSSWLQATVIYVCAAMAVFALSAKSTVKSFQAFRSENGR